MSRAMPTSTGMCRMARPSPPGPDVSPTGWMKPYFERDFHIEHPGVQPANADCGGDNLRAWQHVAPIR